MISFEGKGNYQPLVRDRDQEISGKLWQATREGYLRKQHQWTQECWRWESYKLFYQTIDSVRWVEVENVVADDSEETREMRDDTWADTDNDITAQTAPVSHQFNNCNIPDSLWSVQHCHNTIISNISLKHTSQPTSYLL